MKEINSNAGMQVCRMQEFEDYGLCVLIGGFEDGTENSDYFITF